VASSVILEPRSARSCPRNLRGVCSTGVLKKSAMCDRAARELGGRSPSSAAIGERPASASATPAAGGPAVSPRLAVSVTPLRLSTSKMPPPSPPSVSFCCTGSANIDATAAAMNTPYAVA
jgi:hypothetical protein